MLDGAPQLHEQTPNNILCHFRIRKGEMAEGWAQADVVVEGTYTTSWQEHAYLQPEAGLAFIGEEGRGGGVWGGPRGDPRAGGGAPPPVASLCKMGGRLSPLFAATLGGGRDVL